MISMGSDWKKDPCAYRAFLDDQLNFSDGRGITDATTHGTKEVATNSDFGEAIILKILSILSQAVPSLQC